MTQLFALSFLQLKKKSHRKTEQPKQGRDFIFTALLKILAMGKRSLSPLEIYLLPPY